LPQQIEEINVFIFASYQPIDNAQNGTSGGENGKCRNNTGRG
jgi:hypothetical protein